MLVKEPEKGLWIIILGNEKKKKKEVVTEK